MNKLALALLVPASVLAGSSAQTDWTGGWGVPGPVPSWGSQFSSALLTNWWESPGSLIISVQYAYERHPVTYYGVPNTFCTYGCDIDGDGDQDVLGGAPSPDQVFWYENGSTWTKHMIATDYLVHSILPGDIDGDGSLEIVTAAYFEDEVAWWKRSGSTWTRHNIGGTIESALSAIPADVDGDADLDVLCVAYQSGQVQFWENSDGTGNSWTCHIIKEDVFSLKPLNACDIDGDGDLDILHPSNNEDVIRWYENESGSGDVWQSHTLWSGMDGVSRAVGADIDGDGDLDVITGSPASDEICWLENLSGSGTSWEQHGVGPIEQGGVDFTFGDVDADGDLDILGSGYYSVYWWENNGGGSSWIERYIGYYSSIRTGDFDGDGMLDFLVTMDYNGEISWYRAMPYYASPVWLESSILYTGCDPDYTWIAWNEQAPDQTSVSFIVRASDDPAEMGDWSSPIVSPGSLGGILADNESYLQYRVILSTSDPSVTPTLEDVTFTWNSLGLEEDANPAEVELRIVSNPSVGSPSIEFGLPSGMEASLTVHDLAGRVVAATEPGYCSAGWHSENLGELPSGVYIVSLTAGETGAVERFVVIE
ncbi:MAG: FG-GAP-like repeat-containing protein [Candidatus Fermentibacter sp.]|nr:FG-GAP-like repeat-containing protein [Candidatus Fermentibacter sp.]